MGYLTDADREALYDALCTQPMHADGAHDKVACIVDVEWVAAAHAWTRDGGAA